jgi:protoporphyrinogen/coproporphyrinogen III oxidase
VKVLVVGAGIAGLGTATMLARRGHEVCVLEASDRVGGRAVTYTRAATGDRCDVGTQYYHSSYDRALDLMREVGLADATRRVVGSTRFFDDRHPSGSFLVGHRLPWFKTAGLGGNARLAYFLVSRLLAHPMRTFALEDRPRLDEARALDAVTHPVLREFMVRVVVNAGTLAEPEVTGVSLLQLIRLLRIIVLTDYLVLPEGVASLHERLAARLTVERETPVRHLLVEGGRVEGVVLEGSGRSVRADHVVLAAPPRALEPMLPPAWQAERTFLGGVTFPPAMVVSLFLDRPLERGVWSYMIQAGREQLISFCTDAAQKNPAMVPSGNSVLQAWICHPRAATLAGVPDADVVSRCLAELDAHMPGLPSWVEEAHVMRHAGGTPQHSAGHHGRALAFLQSADRREGVSFAGDYFSGGYLESALWSAERVTARLR